MSATFAFSMIVITITSTYLYIGRNPERSDSVFQRVKLIKRITGVLVVFVGAWVFFQSGDPALILAAIVALMFVTAYLVIDEPTEDM